MENYLKIQFMILLVILSEHCSKTVLVYMFLYPFMFFKLFGCIVIYNQTISGIYTRKESYTVI